MRPTAEPIAPSSDAGHGDAADAAAREFGPRAVLPWLRMGALLPWYALAVITTLLNASTLGFIAWREHVPALKLWAGAWLAWGLAGISLAALGARNRQPLLAVLCGLLWVVSTALFLRGAYVLSQRRPPRAWLGVAGGCAALALALGVGPQGELGMVPLVLFQSIGLITTGVVIIRADGRWAGAWLCGFALVGMGLHVLDAPVLAGRPALFAWGFLLAVALQVLTAVGMLMLHYEWARAQVLAAQQVLDENRRIEALGRVAGGVAHDFNNMLTVMQGYVALMRPGVDSPAELDDSRRAVQEAIERASRLTKQLLAFGRRSLLRPHAVDVREAVMSTIDLLKKVIPENIELHLRSAEGAYTALMDRASLEQIVLNLVTNARDAITGRGCIVVEIERRDEPGPLLLIRVTDDGVGMDEGVMKRVFEPFFTTKPAGRGTGLGLASVQGAVNQLGGQIRVQSQVGVGTTFEVSLPWIAATPSPPPPGERAAPRPLSILVVDDDDNVREVTVKMLRSGGHAVEQASDGHAALDLIRAKPYDLLVSDVVMPRMGGIDLSERARKLRPEMAMLLASGYPLDSPPDTAKVSFLSKPYRPSELLNHVARLAEPRADRRP